jgi:IMP cyclohydrolase
MGRKIAIGPLGAVAYDPLRHYSAIQYEDSSGIAAVSNGIQTEAIFETYRLLHNVNTAPVKEYLKTLMDGANSEPDSLNTPRIGGVITGHQGGLACFVSIKRHNIPAEAFELRLERGVLTGVSTYTGELENPEPFDPTLGLPTLKLDAITPDAVARYLFDISAATNKGQDIRVCTIGGVRTATGWELTIVNAH